jgi:transcription elongation GreA/GreB family factor
MIQSSSPIDIASRNHTRLFIVYVGILVAAAVFTVLLFRAGRQTQQLIKADADARIAEATQKAAEAIERAEKLEADNLILRERAAKAEKDLLQLRERVEKRRTLTQKERDSTVGLLNAYLTLAKQAKEKGESFMIVYPTGKDEAAEFANLLYLLFSQAGWSVQIHDVQYAEHITGISIVVRDPDKPPLYAQVLQNFFRATKFAAYLREEKGMNDDSTFLEVGSLY